MSQAHSRSRDYLIYLLVRIIVCLLQALPFETGCAVAAGLAWLAYRVDRRHRLVAQDNLRQAFPGRYSNEEIDGLVRGVYSHFCTLIIEIVHLQRRMHFCNWRRHLTLRDDKAMIDILLSGRPVMIVTGHFGNWELAGYALGLFGFKAHAIARPLDNPFLDDYLRRFRESTGQKVLAKKGDFDQMQAILDRGGLLETLADQDAGQRGLFVDFFGRPASTHKAIALLCLEQRVPLLVAGTPKIEGEGAGGRRYQVELEDLILPEEYEGRPDAVRAVTQRFTAALERLIRAHPEQYFWLHRRWKHQPKARKKVA